VGFGLRPEASEESIGVKRELSGLRKANEGLERDLSDLRRENKELRNERDLTYLRWENKELRTMVDHDMSYLQSQNKELRTMVDCQQRTNTILDSKVQKLERHLGLAGEGGAPPTPSALDPALRVQPGTPQGPPPDICTASIAAGVKSFTCPDCGKSLSVPVVVSGGQNAFLTDEAFRQVAKWTDSEK